jgi:hypothetical protein
MFSALPTDETQMSSSHLLQRLLRHRRQAAPPAPSRIDIRPPALWGQAEPVWRSLWNWVARRPAAVEAPARVLDIARADFCHALHDIVRAEAVDLLRRAEHARSLRELWHLRAELYSIVARHASQHEADRRLQQVNRHFPTRAAGPGLSSSSERDATSSST